jgi:hypothetical protein
MAKHIEVTVSCDNCGTRDEDVQEFPVYNSKGRQVILDLHPKCHEEVYGPGLDLADDKGQVSEAAKSKATKQYKLADGKRICLLCPETRDTDQTMRTHFQQTHGLSGSFEEAYGAFCPVCNEHFDKIGHHIRQAHKDLNLPHYSHAFLWARDNGDPHGVLNKQIATLQKLSKAA